MQLHFELHEDGNGPYCLLMHGFLSSRAQWRPNVEALKEVCKPVVVELWGHGRSPTPRDAGSYRVEHYASMFDDIRRSLGATQWFVCGQSFGAGLTLRYSLQYPDAVLAQVFTNTMAALSLPGELARAVRMEIHAEQIEREGLDAVRKLPFHPRFARRFPHDIHREMLADAERIDPVAVANALRQTSPFLSVAASFGETRVPTLLVNGSRETRFQPMRERAKNLLPTLEIVDLEGGHSVNIEAAKDFNAAAVGFLRRYQPGEPGFW
ncbi:MAG: alpha/beta fold hydrolase [Betaproteobacteria bacterium]|nr:alpha/beta fold hydrolase [Betaproteobacteria bacterium]